MSRKTRPRTLDAYSRCKRLKVTEERMSMALATPMVVDIPLRREEGLAERGGARPAPVARCVEKRSDGQPCGRCTAGGQKRAGLWPALFLAALHRRKSRPSGLRSDDALLPFDLSS